MNCKELDSKHRFAVVTACYSGPSVSYWSSYGLVIDLLAAYCRSKCASTVSVWQRKSSNGRWVCVAN